MSSTVKLSSSLTSISLASPTEKNSLQNPFWYSLDGDDGFMAVATVAGAGTSASSLAALTYGELRAEKRGAYYALAKNPDKYVSYQQAQQQTEDLEDEDSEEDVRTEEEDPHPGGDPHPGEDDKDHLIPDQDHDEVEDDDSEKIIHL